MQELAIERHLAQSIYYYCCQTATTALTLYKLAAVDDFVV
jgi:hypothetical protein